MHVSSLVETRKTLVRNIRTSSITMGNQIGKKSFYYKVHIDAMNFVDSTVTEQSHNTRKPFTVLIIYMKNYLILIG